MPINVAVLKATPPRERRVALVPVVLTRSSRLHDRDRAAYAAQQRGRDVESNRFSGERQASKSCLARASPFVPVVAGTNSRTARAELGSH